MHYFTADKIACILAEPKMPLLFFERGDSARPDAVEIQYRSLPFRHAKVRGVRRLREKGSGGMGVEFVFDELFPVANIVNARNNQAVPVIWVFVCKRLIVGRPFDQAKVRSWLIGMSVQIGALSARCRGLPFHFRRGYQGDALRKIVGSSNEARCANQQDSHNEADASHAFSPFPFSVESGSGYRPPA